MSNEDTVPTVKKTVLNRHGYKGSGVVLYIAQCEDKDSLNKFVSNTTGSEPFDKDKIPVAYSTLTSHPALGDLIPESVGGMVLQLTLAVVVAEGGKVTEEEEKRSWDHETGHLAYFFGAHGFPGLYEALGYGKAPEEDRSEAAAYLAEWVASCVYHDVYCKDAGYTISSGLPFALPWMDESQEVQ